MINMFFKPDSSDGSSPYDEDLNLSSDEEQDADDYLSNLAKSIISKDARSKSRVAVPKLGPEDLQDDPQPSTGTNTQEQQRSSSSSPANQKISDNAMTSYRTDWLREVSMKDEGGNYLPGTILLFEDGTVGIFKESVPQKDYDIVYHLKDSGRARPEGMALFNYDARSIGRLPSPFLDQIIKTCIWERDVILFHLLKFTDCAHVPAIHHRESVSGTMVPKLTKENLNDKPLLTRGRRMTIDFGGGRKWDAVYYGQDELGHVVAHNTHQKWTLMHLDLEKFKDKIKHGDIIDSDTQSQIERDCMDEGS